MLRPLTRLVLQDSRTHFSAQNDSENVNCKSLGVRRGRFVVIMRAPGAGVSDNQADWPGRLKNTSLLYRDCRM